MKRLECAIVILAEAGIQTHPLLDFGSR